MADGYHKKSRLARKQSAGITPQGLLKEKMWESG
jgi:hypothetical protein